MKSTLYLHCKDNEFADPARQDEMARLEEELDIFDDDFRLNH